MDPCYYWLKAHTSQGSENEVRERIKWQSAGVREIAMGISGLTRLIADNAPQAMRDHGIGAYFGRRVAIDASMSIYQFLVAVRSEGSVLVNEAGETTSHLMGMFYRTIRMVENGIRPIYVFDGAPPDLKSGELSKRVERRSEAEAQLQTAKENGDTAMIDKFNRRTVKATKKHSDDCKELLVLMGIPVVQAPCEAEAQCASLVRLGLAFAAGSEDMDTVTLGCPILLRHLTFSEARKLPISEIHLDAVLEGLQLSMAQFIDLCILMGCDYCETIRGIGPKGALTLIRQHGCIENILQAIKDESRYVVPENWQYQQARSLFTAPKVLPSGDPQLDNAALRWDAPNVEATVAFMAGKHGFREDRIRAGLVKLEKARGGSTQGRLDSFFKVTHIPKAVPVKAVKAKAKRAAK